MSPRELEQDNRGLALALLREGGIVCVPTESSYGLAVDAGSASALERLYKLKGRDEATPFGLIAGSLAQARGCTGAWPMAAEELAAQHWPGALTLLLPPLPATVARLVGPSGFVGVRVSSAPAVTWLATALGRPITATSANPTGQPPARRAEDARAYFGDAVDLYLDEGPCEGQASTLVSFDAAGQARVLREGAITLPPSP